MHIVQGKSFPFDSIDDTFHGLSHHKWNGCRLAPEIDFNTYKHYLTNRRSWVGSQSLPCKLYISAQVLVRADGGPKDRFYDNGI